VSDAEYFLNADCGCNDFGREPCLQCELGISTEEYIEKYCNLDQDDVLQENENFNPLAMCKQGYGVVVINCGSSYI
jgi:hypothetical protein